MKKIIITIGVLLFGLALYATDPPIKTGIKNNGKDIKKVTSKKRIAKDEFSTKQIPNKSIMKNLKSSKPSSPVKPAKAKAEPTSIHK